MRTTKTIMGPKARKAIYDGVNAVAAPVSKTLGPQARKALMFRTFNRGSRIVDDGYTVAECQEPKDQFARLAATTFKEACKRTNEKVGDGTATTATLAGKLFNLAYAQLTDSSSEFTASKIGKVGVSTLRKKILDSAEVIKQKIKDSATKILTLEDLERVAIISVGNEKIGKIVAKMAWDVGVDGFIDVVEGYKGEIETEVIKGMRFPAKVAAKAFVNNAARYEMVMLDCPVLLTNYALDNASEIAAVLSNLNSQTDKIIVMAPSFSDNVLINMVAAMKAGYSIYPVLVPSLRTEQFEDLAVYCKANFIDKQAGKKLANIQFADLGFLEKLVVKDTENKEDAVATGGAGTFSKTDGTEQVETPIQKRLEMLKGQLKETRQEQFKKLLERRIASIASAVGVIRVGEATQASSLDTKLKIEDAVYACKSALRGGYVKGGGLCLKEIAETLPDSDIFKEALQAPYNTIQASVDGGIEIPDDVIDPAEAEYYAVEHAASVVANLITVEIITVEEEDPIQGEGEFAIAKAIREYVVSHKQHIGQIKANEVEMELDRMAGLTVDESISLDNG